MYAIIDVETTGGNPFRDKITEIAVLVHDGNQIVEEFVSLINPERKIPSFISRMTGITDEMVIRAPKFYEIARELVEITRDKIFVAHNASFDCHFVRNEFKALGYDYSR
ncbi:MAG TPA: 3'-5' exonuclease, partial [Bacteroidales bacterium]|nr:3'-5' exonuclease [Bacteroidales bacterium]